MNVCSAMGERLNETHFFISNQRSALLCCIAQYIVSAKQQSTASARVSLLRNVLSRHEPGPSFEPPATSEGSVLDHHRIYEGDEALGLLLAQHGIPADVTAIRGLVAGIAAAPPAVDRQGWLQLVAPRLDAAVAAQLLALEAEMRQAQAAALERRPSPAKRLVLLRRELAQQGFAGFIVPRGDEHQGEYVPSCAERLAWLTGFTGSAGLAIVLAEKAAIFVDGRYTLQVRAETEAGLYEARHLVDDPPATWITANLPPGARLGYDPWLHTPGEIERYAAAAVKAGACLEPCARNPVDAVWSDQPPAPISPIVPHPLRFSGRSAAEKRAELGASLAVARVDGSVELFCDLRKLSPPLAEHLGNAVRTVPRDSFPAALDRLGAEGR